MQSPRSADTLDPQGIEVREVAMRYAQDTPLNRIVDAARGDSSVVRKLENAIRTQLSSPAPEQVTEIRATLLNWRDNNRRLLPYAEKSALLKQAGSFHKTLRELQKSALKP